MAWADTLENYIENWRAMPWAWKQGWLHYKRNPYKYDNPHEVGTEKRKQFDLGWHEADFCTKFDAGYYDW